MTCIEFLCQSNYAQNVKSVEFIFLCILFPVINGYTFIRGAPDPPFPKKSNNHKSEHDEIQLCYWLRLSFVDLDLPNP